MNESDKSHLQQIAQLSRDVSEVDCNGGGLHFKRERLEADPACEGNHANATTSAGCHQVTIQNASGD